MECKQEIPVYGGPADGGNACVVDGDAPDPMLIDTQLEDETYARAYYALIETPRQGYIYEHEKTILVNPDNDLSD